MKLTTTFNKLRKAGACEEGYKKLARALGGVRKYGASVEINLLTVLDANGFYDAVWSLRATLQDSDVTKRLIAADFAESVLHIFEGNIPGDDRPRKAIQAARDYANGVIDLQAMRDARDDAAAAADAAYASYASAAAAAAAASASYASAAAAAAAAAASYAAAAASYAASAASYAASAAASYAASAAADAAYAARKAKKENLTEILRRHLAD